ncbi:MAG TPA: galactose mutarotase [Polyangiaceae bacterium]
MTFSVKENPDRLESLDLGDDARTTRLVLAPARGGMATSLILKKRHLWYLDEATLRDPAQSVRGGNPVLFPSPGKLEGDQYEWQGKKGKLKQHGFGRLLPWTLVSQSGGDDARVTLRLESNDETRKNYPWDFRADYTYILTPEKLRIEMAITNTGSEAMPFGAGFHPYFMVKRNEKGHAKIETNATQAFDNVTKETGPLGPIDLGGDEVDLHFVDHTGPCTLRVGETGAVVRASEDFVRFVVWTQPGKDFVCVEPWTSPGNALNTKEHVIVLEPGQMKNLWVEYASL